MKRVLSYVIAFLACATTGASANAEESGPKEVRVRITCFGDTAKGAQVTLKWGHTNKDDHPYLILVAKPAMTAEGKFKMPDSESELEIQSEGGHPTGYLIEIFFDGRQVLHLVHNQNGGSNYSNLGGVNVKRSSPLNDYGEQNIRVFTNKPQNPGEIK